MGERQAQRSSYPLTIPDALLHSDVMQRACTARNFQEIFRLVNRRTGTSYADMAKLSGILSMDWDPPHGPWGDRIVIIFDGGELSSPEAESLRPRDSELSACACRNARTRRLALLGLE